MSCIINVTHAKRRCTFARHVAAIHKTTHKLRKNFLREVICRHATLKRRESKGNRQTCHAIWATCLCCSSVVFVTIDPGVPLIINASIGEAWDSPGTVIINSRMTPPRPVAFLRWHNISVFRGLCYFFFAPQSRLKYLKKKLIYAIL